MVDPVTSRRISYWCIFTAIWVFILFVRLLPLDIHAGGWPGPNWTMLFAFAWVSRRPDFVPVLLIAVLLLLDDLIFMRAPGLWAGLSVVGLEFLRNRSQFSRELPFLFEWAIVASVISGVMLSNRLMSSIFVITQPSLSLDSIYLIVTVAAYPLIVMISSQILGVRHAAPGQTDQKGHRI